MIHLAQSSSIRAQDTLVRALYLKRIQRLLEKEPQTVIDRMEEIRRALCRFSNFRVLVVANLEKLANPVSSWKVLTAELDTSGPLLKLESRKANMSEAGLHPGKLAYIVPMAPIDSSYALFATTGPDSYEHPQLPAVMVTLAFLEAVEGPLWVAVRGTGLAYGASFSHSVDKGQLRLSIYRSPDAFKAYAAAKKVISDFESGATPFEAPALEGAISTIVVGFANEQPTMASAANLGFMNQVIRDIPKGWSDEMLRKVREVGVEEIKAVLREVVMPVFEPSKADMVITCATIMQDVSCSETATIFAC